MGCEGRTKAKLEEAEKSSQESHDRTQLDSSEKNPVESEKGNRHRIKKGWPWSEGLETTWGSGAEHK